MVQLPESRSPELTPTVLPSGTITFLFTDIEGSSERWESHPAAMRVAVSRHEAMMRAAIARHSGYIFKTVGDAFCAAFRTPRAAFEAAIAAQRALHDEKFADIGGLSVRMGLHTGVAEERDGDYFGPVVNRTARLMSIGHGGQVLLSSAVKALVADEPLDGVSIVDLGERRLKDLSLPEHVWQATIAGLESVFPALRSLDARPNNLPVQPNPLLGRERDLAAVKTLLASHRLLTLSGSGGVGKTRLALEAGADLIDRYGHGVWFVDLAPIADDGLVSSVVARALEINHTGDTGNESILRILKRRELLLILDNCEHLLDAIAPLADSILKTCPNVRLLATSRQSLGITGEVVHRLPSLAVPDLPIAVIAKDARSYGAIALFTERARAADTRFELSDDTAPIVAGICRRLDGIPLALELAAARVKVLSIPNLAQRLDERFKLLTGGSRTALPRQKTLAALIEWSYNLLTVTEQTFFNRLAIFAGNFSLDAATVVCAGGDIGADDVLDLLSSLADKSLILADTDGERERYRLLESTGAYAIEKLTASGERDLLARCHAEYFRGGAHVSDARRGRGSILAWLARVEPDLDNYRAALDWTLKQNNDAALGASIAGELDRLWAARGLAVEGRYWLRLAIERLNESDQPRLVALAWLNLAWLVAGKHKYEASAHALKIYESLGDVRGANRARRTLAGALYQLGRVDEAVEMNLHALAALREAGYEFDAALCVAQQAILEEIRGDFRAGRELGAQAISLFDALGYEQGASSTRGNLALLEFADGHPDRALTLTNEALEFHQQLNHAEFIATGYTNAAVYRIALGDFTGARTAAREGLRVARLVQVSLLSASALQHLALLAALESDAQNAARLTGYVEARFKELDMEREITEKWSYEKLLAALRERLSDTAIAAFGREGAAWSEDRAVEEALKC
jgi:predicted ATPase/class 3 adenylate cyclase